MNSTDLEALRAKASEVDEENMAAAARLMRQAATEIGDYRYLIGNLLRSLVAIVPAANEPSEEQIAMAFCKGLGRWGTVTDGEWPGYILVAREILPIVRAAVLFEREACARICEEPLGGPRNPDAGPPDIGLDIAAAKIRARK